jgi:hypothetical protein
MDGGRRKWWGAEEHPTLRLLFRQARSVNYLLKDATFRSHLHRMKKKGTITSPKWGFWRIVKGQ